MVMDTEPVEKPVEQPADAPKLHKVVSVYRVTSPHKPPYWGVRDGFGAKGEHTGDLVPYDSISEMPEPYRSKLALLVLTEVGFRDQRLGRKLGEDIFWVYIYEGESE
jgi:hypothetical protein